MIKIRSLVSALTAFGMAWALQSTTAGAADCPRGDLDKRFCDWNNDLVADTPADGSQWIDPDTLVFSYTPVEDPSVYENVFTEFMDYMAKRTSSWRMLMI